MSVAPCSHCGEVHPPEAMHCPRTGASMRERGPCGTRVDRYVVERLVGSGAFGSVYRAHHELLGQPVALKILHPTRAAEATSVERFVREARAMAALDHPHITRVLDCGMIAAGSPFFVLEWLDGRTLDDLMSERGKLPALQAVDFAMQILDAMVAMGARGVVHRDMKPANVMLVRSPDATAKSGAELDFVKVVDFGVSKMLGDAGITLLTQTGMAIGTPRYMAPEQLQDARAVDVRADVYAVAVMLYEMLAGEPPFTAHSIDELVVKIASGRHKSLDVVAPEVPRRLVSVVERALARDRDARFRTPEAMLAALLDAVDVPDGDADGGASTSELMGFSLGHARTAVLEMDPGVRPASLAFPVIPVTRAGPDRGPPLAAHAGAAPVAVIVPSAVAAPPAPPRPSARPQPAAQAHVVHEPPFAPQPPPRLLPHPAGQPSDRAFAAQQPPPPASVPPPAMGAPQAAGAHGTASPAHAAGRPPAPRARRGKGPPTVWIVVAFACALLALLVVVAVGIRVVAEWTSATTVGHTSTQTP